MMTAKRLKSALAPLRHALATADAASLRPALGLAFAPDAKLLAFIYARARNRYRDTPVLGVDVGAKVLGPMAKRTVEDANTVSVVTMADIEALAKAI